MAALTEAETLSHIKEIHKKLKKAGIKVQIGQAYNFYDCGCIINNKIDKNRLKHNYDTHQRVRACPDCTGKNVGFLVIKYKKCQCGAEFASKGVHASEYCSKCPNSLRSTGILKVKAEKLKFKLDFQQKNNLEFQDENRWDCFFRDNCYNFYCMHETIPCKGCELYIGMGLDLSKITRRVTEEDTIYN